MTAKKAVKKTPEKTKTAKDFATTLSITDNLPEKKKDSVIAFEQWNQYLAKNIVNDFAKVPAYVKLTFLQSIPSDLILFRNIGGVDFPYIPHEFSEKALNFVFNFNINAEVVSKECSEGSIKSGAKFIEVMVEVKFTFWDGDREIVRTVFSGHKGFENPATTKADAYKSALSKAYTIVARQFGIGSNVKTITKTTKGRPQTTIVPMAQKEQEAYKKAEEQPKPAVKKSFGKKTSAGF